MNGSTDNRARLALVVSLAIMVIAISATINSRSFWLDEAYSWGIVAQPSWNGFLLGLESASGNMFGYLSLLRVWSILGDSEMVLRLPSAGFALGTVIVGYGLAKRIFGPDVAGVTALLLASSVPLTFYATEARSYAMLAFFGALCWLVTDIAVRGDRTTSWLLLGVVALGAVSAHMVALMLLPTIGVIVKLRFSWSAAILRCVPVGLAGASALGVIAFSPAREASFPPPVSPMVIARSARLLLGDHGTFTRDNSGFAVMAITLALLLVATAFFVRERTWSNHRQVAVWLAALLPPVTTVAVSIVATPLLWHRMLLGSLVPVVILAAHALVRIPARRVAMVIGGLLIGLSLMRTAAISTISLWEFRELHDYLEETTAPGTSLIFIETWERAGIDYYFRDEPDRLVMNPALGPNWVFGDMADNATVIDGLEPGDHLVVIDAALEGQVWSDDERAMAVFDFAVFEALRPSGLEPTDEAIVGRFLVRSFQLNAN